MSSPEQLLSEQARGSMSRIVLGEIGTTLRMIEKETVDGLKNLYRNGDLDPVKLAVGVGKLTAIEDLEIRLKSQINRGEAATKEMTRDHRQ